MFLDIRDILQESLRRCGTLRPSLLLGDTAATPSIFSLLEPRISELLSGLDLDIPREKLPGFSMRIGEERILLLFHEKEYMLCKIHPVMGNVP